MSAQVDIYRSDDYVLSERIELYPLLRAFFEPLLGMKLGSARFRLAFLPVEDRNRLDGEPSVVNLRGSHGYVQVRITMDDEVLYQHAHSLHELVGRPLQALLGRLDPQERHWGFGIVGPGVDTGSLIRPKPEVAMHANATEFRSRSRLFHIEEVEEPEPPRATLAELGSTDPLEHAEGPITVLLQPDAFAELAEGLPFSEEIEEGGFLVGHVYTDADRPERYLVLITSVLPAERTGASLLEFNFTGDSFIRASEAIAKRGRDELLVGWYHTHLFAATSAIGLSSIDIDLHRTTFRRRWQVAGLVNLHERSRMVRFYAVSDEEVDQLNYGMVVP
jgi:hypothetical protein